MRVIGIKVLKNKLSEYVKIAAAGERVLVTDRDRVVAELRAPDPDLNLPEAALADAVRLGWLKPAMRSVGEVPARRPVASFAVLLSELDADREDR